MWPHGVRWLDEETGVQQARGSRVRDPAATGATPMRWRSTSRRSGEPVQTDLEAWLAVYPAATAAARSREAGHAAAGRWRKAADVGERMGLRGAGGEVGQRCQRTSCLPLHRERLTVARCTLPQ